MEEGLRFDHGCLGDRARLLQCLHHAYLEILRDPLKTGGPTECRTQQFSRGFWTSYMDQNMPFKRWESPGRLGSNGLEI